MAGIWTAEREQAAKTLFQCGASASESSANLSHQFGFNVTRNAVIGLWHRRKWSGRENRLPTKRRTPEPRNAAQLTKRPRVARVKIIEPQAPAKPIEHKRVMRLISAPHGSLRPHETVLTEVAPLRSVAVEPLLVSLVDLQHDQCRYPFGDGPFLFCGCPAAPGKPYCEPHHQLCNTVYASVSMAERRSAAMTRRWQHKKAQQEEATA